MIKAFLGCLLALAAVAFVIWFGIDKNPHRRNR